MKFVYFGYDYMLPAVQRLIEDGHELIGIFSFECDNVFNFNQACQELAAQLNIPIHFEKATSEAIGAFINDGAKVFLSAGYPHKIPPIDENKAYAINVHPTYLPFARGLMPIPHIIINNEEQAAGFTAHKMTQKFDEGDILLQHKFDLSDKETVESYTAKISLKAPDLISSLMQNIDTLWAYASPQNAAHAYTVKAPTDQDRILNWNTPVIEIDRVARAFGRYGSIAQIEGHTYIVFDHDFWEEKHNLPPGTIAAINSRELTIAAKNGYILLKEFRAAE